MYPQRESSLAAVDNYLDIDDAELEALLGEHGCDINTFRRSREESAARDREDAELVPLRKGWLALSSDESGRLIGKWVDHPGGMIRTCG